MPIHKILVPVDLSVRSLEPPRTRGRRLPNSAPGWCSSAPCRTDGRLERRSGKSGINSVRCLPLTASCFVRVDPLRLLSIPQRQSVPISS